MGYKLAGFDVLGGVEIDPEIMAIYRANHKPKHSYLMGVQQFNNLPLESLPNELKNLDLLDGSPPCSSFSMAGSREKKWGNAHHFREGQARQILDDLFFHFNHNIDEHGFRQVQEQQKLMVDFPDYPNVLIRMFNMCIKEPQSHLAVFVIERQGLARLDFIQNMEYKFVELLSV